MSIASDFREKWGAIMRATDASRGDGDDARFAAMQRAADAVDCALIPKAMIGAYQETIKKLKDENDRA